MSKGINKRTKRSLEEYIYPNIAVWMMANDMPIMEFAAKLDIAHMTFKKYMTGKREPTKYMIDKILDVTGMTYEEAFAHELK